MAERTAPAPARYRTGFCQTAHHGLCPGAVAGVECACSCHRTCPACGRPTPPGGTR